MRVDEFTFDLPERLIAQVPLPDRSASRLLCLDRGNGHLSDRRITDLPSLLRAGDLLIFNDTRVIPARLFGKKASGGAVEVLIERVLDERLVWAHVRASKSPKPKSVLILEGELQVEVRGRQGELFELAFLGEESVLDALNRKGRIPLPPYMQREAGVEDRERYQTVFARVPGAAAAPTAGLHFDQPLLEVLAARGVDTAYVTLHVGAGTFQPPRVEIVEEHVMHRERVFVSAQVVDKIAATKARGGRVVAVGTTVVRSLESAAASGVLAPLQGETQIFIYPGYQFKVVDALVTNFHLPTSTLLMLVSAFAGKQAVLNAYKHAVTEEYRFYSYGDAMFIA